MIVEKTVNQKG